MLNQLIPAVCIFVLFAVNIMRKKSVLCISSLVLAYNLVAMTGAVLMYMDPRTGDPYTSCEAMLFFSLCYTLFCIPALFYRDGRLLQRNVAGVSDLLDEDRFVLLARCVACMTFLSFSYFLVDSLPNLRTFLSGAMSREDYRATIDVSHTASPLVALLSFFGTLNFVSLFLGVVIYLFLPHRRMLSVLLLAGGLTNAVNMLKNASRSGLVEAMCFAFSVGYVLWSRVPFAVRSRIRRMCIVTMLIVLLPFALITVVRFGSGNSEQGVLYSLASYFSTGPYSFNADYTARVEYDSPRLGGFFTCPYLLILLDRITGSTGIYDEGQILVDEMYEGNGWKEYQLVCGAYSGEFKTAVGCVMMDYPLWVVVTIFSLLAIVFSRMFCRTAYSFSGYLWAAVYFYCLFMGPIGFSFVTRYKNTMLLGLIALGCVLHFVKRRQAGSEMRQVADGGKGIHNCSCI